MNSIRRAFGSLLSRTSSYGSTNSPSLSCHHGACSTPSGFGYMYAKNAGCGRRWSPGQNPAQKYSASPPSRMITSASGGVSTGRPEYSDAVRSSEPHQSSTGGVFPRKRARNSRNTATMPRSARQNRVTASPSYVACAVSSGNRIGSGTSDGNVEHLAAGMRDRRRRDAAPGQIERHVRPLRLERRERESHLADHLQLHVQRVARVLPLRVGEYRPER